MPQGAKQSGIYTQQRMSLVNSRVALMQYQFDSNAVRVDNVVGDQIGHLPRKIVEKLSPYMVGSMT